MGRGRCAVGCALVGGGGDGSGWTLAGSHGGGGARECSQRFGSSRAHYKGLADSDRRARVAAGRCAAAVHHAIALAALAAGRQVEMRQEVIPRQEMREGARDQRPRQLRQQLLPQPLQRPRQLLQIGAVRMVCACRARAVRVPCVGLDEAGQGFVRGEGHLQRHVGGGVAVVACRAPATSGRGVRLGLLYNGVARRALDELPRRVRHQRALVGVRVRVRVRVRDKVRVRVRVRARVRVRVRVGVGVRVRHPARLGPSHPHCLLPRRSRLRPATRQPPPGKGSGSI